MDVVVTTVFVLVLLGDLDTFSLTSQVFSSITLELEGPHLTLSTIQTVSSSLASIVSFTFTGFSFPLLFSLSISVLIETGAINLVVISLVV